MKTTAVVLGFILVSAAAAPASANVRATSDAAPVTASAASTAATVTDPNASQPEARLICRRQETTGSRVGGNRICLTKEQWRTVYSGGSVTTTQRRVR